MQSADGWQTVSNFARQADRVMKQINVIDDFARQALTREVFERSSQFPEEEGALIQLHFRA